MKLDIARAWKDETYRQTLSEEELNTLPANPAGEVADADLEAVAGACAPVGGAFPCVGPCSSNLILERQESVALICEINIFSLAVLGNIALLGSASQHCSKG
jgi:mersacidin/lichenicidin family type 2 lantibiotic